MSKKIVVQSEKSASELTVEDSMRVYLRAATSENTRKAYQSDVKHFMSWGGLLPTTPDRLLVYLQTYASKLNPRTLTRRLTAIRQWHICQGFTDPSAHPLIRKLLTGIYHVHGRPADKAPALSLEQLILMSKYLSGRAGLADWRDNALLQVGFFGAFRRSELVSILWEHIQYVEKGMEILIPRSKTDQKGEGNVCAIPYGKSVLCPVSALKKWQHACSRSSGPVFCGITKTDTLRSKALDTRSISMIIKQHAIACELPKAASYSGHSLRRGFATTAVARGATINSIMRQGRWKNEATMHGYVEEGQRFKGNAADVILE